MFSKFISAVFLLLTFACGNSSGSSAAVVVRPSLTSSTPDDGTHFVTIPNSVTLVFSGAVDTTVTAFSFDPASTCTTAPDILSIAGSGTDTLTVNLDTNGSCNLTQTLILSIDMSAVAFSSNNVAGTGTSSVTLTKRFLRMFVQGLISNGNLGGTAGADAFCMQANGGINDGHSFKALLTDATRVACTSANCGVGGSGEHLDWVLAPSTSYVRPDNTTLIGSTDANGLLIFPLTHLPDDAPTNFWSALNDDWTSTATNCNNWTSSLNSDLGDTGTNIFGGFDIATGSNACDNLGSVTIVCVEQ